MSNEASTKVVITQKQNAKKMKVLLEKNKALDKSYRMRMIDDASFSDFTPLSLSASVDDIVVGGKTLLNMDQVMDNSSKYICIPIYEEFLDRLVAREKEDVDDADHKTMLNMFIGHAKQKCLYSSTVMGDAVKRAKLASNSSFDVVKNALVNTVLDFELQQKQKSNLEDWNRMVNDQVGSLSRISAPPKLEIMGDDRTLVIPFRALNLETDDAFEGMIRNIVGSARMNDFMISLWGKLATLFRSKRVVRRGEISPDSKVRESGHSILWIDPALDAELSADYGEGSHGWITITEQGIKQSYDFTRVMFSRGNVSEKIRFGKLVKSGELLLDMYAGIGYYTLPALVHGEAKHVYACEWNPHAASFLRYNLEQNGLSNRATVLVGDSRKTVVEEGVLELDFDRVSLGLLPSSEGGWEISLRALNSSRGWLHIHANVPTHEKDRWSLWMCKRLLVMYQEINPEKYSSAYIICHNIERVKSFSPKVDHIVADVFVGTELPEEICSVMDVNRVGMRAGVYTKGVFVDNDIDIEIPSCALGNGILDQEWMK